LDGRRHLENARKPKRDHNHYDRGGYTTGPIPGVFRFLRHGRKPRIQSHHWDLKNFMVTPKIFSRDGDPVLLEASI
jgi:hypothetical protein